MRVPSGYEEARIGGARVMTRPHLLSFVTAALDAAGTLYAWAARQPRDMKQGRTTAYVVGAPGGEWVVRHYRRGGEVASLLGDRYFRFGTPRPFAELWASALARARGIDTPAVAAVAVYPDGTFYRGDIATECVPESAALADLSVGAGRRGDRDRRAAWRETGRFLRRVADAGIVHVDLNIRNILIAWRLGLPRPYLLDLDRCRILNRTGRADLAKMVRRLHRSTRKIERQSGQSLQDELDELHAGLRA